MQKISNYKDIYLNTSQKLEKLLSKSNFGCYQQILKILYKIRVYFKIIYRIYSLIIILLKQTNGIINNKRYASFINIQTQSTILFVTC